MFIKSLPQVFMLPIWPFPRISVEKDWIVCLCQNNTSLLSKVNTNVRTIDLICNLTAPTLAGQVLYFFPYYIAGVVLIFWVILNDVTHWIIDYRNICRFYFQLQWSFFSWSIFTIKIGFSTTNRLIKGNYILG